MKNIDSDTGLRGFIRLDVITTPFVQMVKAHLSKPPADKQVMFRIIDRPELDQLGADSNAILALAADPKVELVFSGAVIAATTTINGPGTAIQQSPLDGVFLPTHGGHHGYDPRDLHMYTGFIAFGLCIRPGGHITELREVDIAPLVARLLGLSFTGPDGTLVPGILSAH